jgi:uncharacterized protein YdeI (YjbR/CyaY-like superfamily)
MTQPPPNSVQLKSRAEWRKWLKKNHTQKEGVWVITFKKASGRPHVPYEAIVEEALCFGWIDSKGNKLDEERSMLWCAPRKAKSHWSRPNKIRVEKLLAAGSIEPAGLAKIEAARKDGTWTALDPVEALEIPQDLQAALNSNHEANKYFTAFPRSAKRAILEWILNAKKSETRAKRIAETVEFAAKNLRANQWKPQQSQK